MVDMATSGEGEDCVVACGPPPPTYLCDPNQRIDHLWDDDRPPQPVKVTHPVTKCQVYLPPTRPASSSEMEQLAKHQAHTHARWSLTMFYSIILVFTIINTLAWSLQQGSLHFLSGLAEPIKQNLFTAPLACLFTFVLLVAFPHMPNTRRTWYWCCLGTFVICAADVGVQIAVRDTVKVRISYLVVLVFACVLGVTSYSKSKRYGILEMQTAREAACLKASADWLSDGSAEAVGYAKPVQCCSVWVEMGEDNKARSKVTYLCASGVGCTVEVVGNCGHGCGELGKRASAQTVQLVSGDMSVFGIIRSQVPDYHYMHPVAGSRSKMITPSAFSLERAHMRVCYAAEQLIASRLEDGAFEEILMDESSLSGYPTPTVMEIKSESLGDRVDSTGMTDISEPSPAIHMRLRKKTVSQVVHPVTGCAVQMPYMPSRMSRAQIDPVQLLAAIMRSFWIWLFCMIMTTVYVIAIIFIPLLPFPVIVLVTTAAVAWLVAVTCIYTLMCKRRPDIFWRPKVTSSIIEKWMASDTTSSPGPGVCYLVSSRQGGMLVTYLYGNGLGCTLEVTGNHATSRLTWKGLRVHEPAVEGQVVSLVSGNDSAVNASLRRIPHFKMLGHHWPCTGAKRMESAGFMGMRIEDIEHAHMGVYYYASQRRIQREGGQAYDIAVKM